MKYLISDSISYEMLLPDDVPYDLEYMLRQSRALTTLNYKKHLNDVIIQAKQDAINYPWLLKFPLLKYYNLSKDIKKLRYCVNDSIQYDINGQKQYRFVFTSIDKSNKYSLESYEHFTTKDGVIVYLPYLSVVANIRNSKFNSLSIYTVGFFDDIPPDKKLYRAEYKTNIVVDLVAKTKDIINIDSETIIKGKIIKEMFLKYIENMNIDLILKRIRSFVFEKIKLHLLKANEDFKNFVEDKKLNFMKGFDILKYFKVENIVLKLNFDQDKTTATKIFFSNYVGKNITKPVFLFNNGTIMFEPGFSVEIKSSEQDKLVECIKFTTSIRFENIPRDSDYYLDTSLTVVLFESSSTYKID